MKKLSAIIVLAALFCSCESPSSNKQKPGSVYEDKKKSLEDIERETPLKFLKISGSHHFNLIKQIVIQGEISNNATIASYKDVELQVVLLDKNGKVKDKERHIVNNTVNPKSSIPFKIKVRDTKGISSVTFDIVKATVAK